MTGKLERERSQLLLIDFQERLVPAIDGHAGIVETSERLIRYARRLGVPITISEQYPKGLGPTVASLKAAAGNAATTLDKVEFSCMANAGLAACLAANRHAGRTQIVVAGVEAHVCVLQSALDFVSAGYEVFLAADAVGSRAATSRSLALDRLRSAGASIVDNEMIAFEWLERAGTPEFKELQALLK